MNMRDFTLSELERIEPQTGELEDALQMDQDAFQAFYERTSRPVWAYLWRRCGDRQLTDDLLQETYYRFLRARVSYESETHRKNYLFRIASNLVNDAWRSRENLTPLPDDDRETGIAHDPQTADHNQRRADVKRAMDRLKPRQRDALWLAYAEGSSHEEIAVILGVKAASIKVLLFRARRKLARLLRGERRTS